MTFKSASRKEPVVELELDSPESFRVKAKALLPGDARLDTCFICGACASGCPASGVSDMDPRRFVRMLAMGMDEEILASDWVWVCTTCNRCVHVCPMQIDIPQLVSMVREQWPEERKPSGIRDVCSKALNSQSCASTGLSPDDFKFIVEEIADDLRQNQNGFEQINVPIDKKKTRFFLNQSSRMPTSEPQEMAPLWKILHLAGVDWTYSSKGWAAENYCMFLGRDDAWQTLVSRKATAVRKLGCDILLNTECGHDFFAVYQGLEKFKIPHSFEVKNIIEYYAKWIRNGRLKVNSDWNLDRKIKFTVQDPCQLVRKSQGDFIAQELRFVIKAAVGEENFVDMSPNCSNNYCCGGGGGALKSDFVEERMAYGKTKLDQIIETRADYCITPCNNCHSQILDLSRHYEASFNTVHLWTILCLSMGVLGKTERKYLGRDLADVGLKENR